MGKNIVLMGFMGTGKSATGQLVAQALQRTFVDMDERIEAQAGKPISQLFADEGEPFFRQLERHLVQQLSSESDLVIATGGGVVLNPDNIADFQKSGVVICLHASPEIILARVARDSHRPLLEQDSDKAATIRALLAKRQPLYRAIPLGIDTEAHTPEDTAQAVLNMFNENA